MVTPIDVALLMKHNKAEVHAKHFIVDGFKDHVVPHIAEMKTANAMWTTLTTMYQGKSV